MKKFSMMLTLLATVLLSVVGCDKGPDEPIVKKPTISVAEAVVNAETMKASVEVTPSSNATAWSWKVDTAEEAGEYTLVNGSAKATIEVAVEYDVEYTFTAFAKNSAGESSPVSVTFVGPEAPVTPPAEDATIAIGEVTVNPETLKANVTVTPSESTAKWYYAMTEANAATVEPTYTEVEGNEAKNLEFDVEAGKSYILVAYAVNADGKESEKASATFNGPEKTDEEPSGNGELVKLELKNITALSVDADVLKYKECVKYVAGIYHTEAYNESRFIAAAKNSLNPNSSYPYVQFNSATASKVWTEMDLLKDGLTTKEGNTGMAITSGMAYTVAVYAEDAEGKSKVYVQEFTAPAAKVDGDVKVGLTLDNIGMTDLTATITADKECRIITDTRLAVNAQDKFDVNTMSADEIKAYLATNANTVPHTLINSETTTFTADLGIDTDYIVYAIAIKDGKIGDVAYEKFHTKRPELTGKGAVTAAEFVGQSEDLYTLIYNITTNADTKKVRVYCSTSFDYNQNADGYLDYIFVSEDASYMWTEYDVVDGKVAVESEITVPGDQYAVYAMAFDADGNPGQVTNLVKLWNSELNYYQTKAEAEEGSKVDMTGTGEVTLKVKQGGVTEEAAAAVVSIASKSENVAKAWLLYFNEEKENNIEAAVEANLQEWDGTTESIFGAKKEITFAEGEEFAYEDMIPYDESWGGTVVAVLTLDTDGKFNVSDYYLAGTGDKGVDAPSALTPTGDAIINVKEVSVADPSSISVKVQVTQVNTEFEFGWILRLSDDTTEDQISDKVYAAFEDFGSTGMISGSCKEFTYGEVVEYNSLIGYSEQYGGNILAVVGISADGTPILADYYLAGTGDKGTVTEGGDDVEPGTDVYSGLYKGATLAVVTEDVTDPTAASATVKVENVNSEVKTYILRIQGSPAKVKDLVNTAFAEYDGTLSSIVGAKNEVTVEADEFSYEYMEVYDAAYAEYAYNIIVVEVHDNVPYAVSAYCPGAGVANGDQEIGQGGGGEVVEHNPVLTLVSEDVADPSSASATLSVSGIGTGYTGWLINLGSTALVADVESRIADLFADGTPSASAIGAYRTIENGAESTFQSMMTYHPEYGGNIIAFVAVDADGNASVVNYYVCGQGLAGGATSDAPAMALVSEDVSAGTATFTVSNLPAEGTAWLLNLGNDAKTNEIGSKVAMLFEDGDPIESDAYRKVAEGTEYSYNGMLSYDEQWGGSIIVLVVVKDGVPTAYNYYTCGVGMSGDEGGEEDGEDVGFGGSTPSVDEVGDDVGVGGDTPAVE